MLLGLSLYLDGATIGAPEQRQWARQLLLLPTCVAALLLVPAFPFPVARVLGSWAPPSAASGAESHQSRGGKAVTNLRDCESLGP